MAKGERLFVKVTRESLPQVKDKYPFLYLERGRLEIDDSSVKWIDADCNVVPIPVATINTLLLGPGTSVTHDAIKTATAANCAVSWVGEDSLLFYAAGFLPTADTRNLKLQMALATDEASSLKVARAMFAKRFPDADLESKTLNSMMGMEGNRVRALYQQKAEEYGVGWKGRRTLNFYTQSILDPSAFAPGLDFLSGRTAGHFWPRSFSDFLSEVGMKRCDWFKNSFRNVFFH
jgi:CRISPR-associated protein Cas1